MPFRDLFLDAMRRTAATVSVVTTSGPGRNPVGVTVSSLSSLSADPCMLLICVHHLSRAAVEISINRTFCVNVLPSHHAAMADCFAGRSQEMDERFKIGAWNTSGTRAPSLDDSIASLDCELEWSKQFASHYIFVGKVVGIMARDGCPLVYADRSYRQLAPAVQT